MSALGKLPIDHLALLGDEARMKSRRRPTTALVPVESQHRPARFIDIDLFLTQQRKCERDTELNQQWDELIRLTLGAWEWRDPESLAELQVCLADLRGRIRTEWQE